MESYPIGKLNFATRVTSASIANISEFATLKVFTASFALNAPGPSGSSGSSFTNTGPVGPQGATGPQGPKGLGVYLIASSLVTCSYAQSLGYSSVDGTTACSAGQGTYYSNTSTLTFATLLFGDVKQQTNASTGYYSNGSTYWYVLSGNLQDSGTACSGGGGGGGGGCSGTCYDGAGCTGGCSCSTNEGFGFCQDPEPQ